MKKITFLSTLLLLSLCLRGQADNGTNSYLADKDHDNHDHHHDNDRHYHDDDDDGQDDDDRSHSDVHG